MKWLSENYKWFTPVLALLTGIGGFLIGIYTEQTSITTKHDLFYEDYKELKEEVYELRNERIYNIEQWIGRVNF